jgi:hypothetical protein
LKNNMPLFAKTFGAVALCVAGLGACGDNKMQPNPEVTRAIGLLASSVQNDTIQFNGTVVKSEVFNDFANPGQAARSVITYNLLEHQLCHSNMTDTDKSKPVCHAESDFSNRQQQAIRMVLCGGAMVKSNRAYQQVFCVPRKFV